jgi:Cu(I)/Ag(I) efflux system membrane fusion protein
MTTREKKLIAAGAVAGILIAVLVLGLFGVQGAHFFASAPAVIAAQPASSTQPISNSISATGTQPGATVELSPAEITAAGVQVAEVRTASLKTDIDAFGRVEQPEAQLAAVSARIGGRVDKLYVQYTGERVRSGQAVADVYSPEVATAVEEYRLGRKTAMDFASQTILLHGHRRTRWSGKPATSWSFGVSPTSKLSAPEKDGVPHVTIFAYASGTVVERKVTQGQYVNAGDTLFTVADLSQVWIKADVYEEQLPQIRQGQEVDITAESLPNKTSTAMWTSSSLPPIRRRARCRFMCTSPIRACACCRACL